MTAVPRRMRNIFRVRFYASLAGAVSAVLVAAVLNRSSLPWVFLLVAAHMLFNQPYLYWGLKLRLGTRLLGLIHLTFDIIIITLVIYFLGGLQSSIFAVVYILVMLFAAVVFGPRAGYWIMSLSLIAFLIMALLEIFQLTPPQPGLQLENLSLSHFLITFLVIVVLFLLPATMGAYLNLVVLENERSLERSVERYQRLLREMGEALMVLTAEGTIYETNPKAAELFGRSREELWEKNFADMLHPETAAEVAVLIQNVLTAGRVQAKNWRVPLPDGSERVTEVAASPYLFPDGSEGVFIILRDVTEERRLSAELRRYSEELELRVEQRTAELEESREIYQSLFERAAVPLCWLDREGVLQSGNRSFYELTRLDRKQEGSLWLVEIIPDLTTQRHMAETLVRHRQGFEAPGRLEVEIKRPDGSRRITEWFLYFNPLTDQHLLSMIDITERRQAEEALRDSEERYRSLVAASPDPILLTGRDAAILMVNPQTVAFYGAESEAELIGKNIYEMIAPEDREKARKNSIQVLKTGVLRRQEYVLLKRNGEKYWGEISSAAVHDPSGEVIAFVNIIRDMTERKKFLDSLRDSEERYRTTIDWLGDMIHVADQDLRILLLNRRFKEMIKELGLSAAGPGDHIFEAFPFLPAKVREEYNHVLTTGEPLITEEEMEIGGRRFYTETRKIPVKEENRVTRIITVMRDITRRKKAEFELAQYRDHLEEQVKKRTAELMAANDQLRREIAERQAAEEALRQSEERYRLLADNVTDVIWTASFPEVRLTYASPSVVRLRGYTPNEVLTQKMEEILLPESVQRVSQLIAEELAIEHRPDKDLSRSRTVELEVRCKDGSTVWTEETVTFLRNSEGRAVGILGVSRNITKRKKVEAELARYRERLEELVEIRTAELLDANIKLQEEIAERTRAEEMLREREEYFRSLIENAADIIFIMDREGRVTFVSPAVERLLGYQPEEICGRNALEFTHPEELPFLARQLEEGRRQARGRAQLEFRVRHRDGSWRTMEAVFTNMLENPHVQGFIINSRDVTERCRTEEALRESEARLRSFLENSPDYIAILDRERRLVFLNRLVQQRSVNELLGRKLSDFIPAAWLEETNPLVEMAFEDRVSPSPITISAFNRWFELRLVPLRHAGTVEGVMGIATDITERKEMERLRAEMWEKLKEAERLAAVGEIAAGVVHQMNSPLTAVSYYAQALSRTKKLEAADKEKVEKIQEAAERIQSLLRRVMTYASVSPPAFGPVKLNPLIRQVLDAISYETARRPRARLELDLTERLPPIRGAVEHLYDLVSNLVINALQALGEEPGVVRIITRHDREKDEVILQVEDTGEGIAPEDVDEIFKPFFRRRRSGEGSGLGLAIVKRVVELHEGRIEVDSAPQRGSTFTVFLPVIS